MNNTVDERVLNFLPQRPPFLFVDKIISIDGNKIITQRLLRSDEDFFKGHFPELPIMPGVLLLENLFQTGALLMEKDLSSEEKDSKIGVVSRVDKTKFKRPCRPGDLLQTEVELVEQFEFKYSFKGQISVGDVTIASAHFSCTLVDKNLIKAGTN